MSEKTEQARPILVSIISHGHGPHVESLLRDLALPGNAEWIRVALTLNIIESADYLRAEWPFPISTRENHRPLGFGENHNAAFRGCLDDSEVRIFCVLNPDIRLPAGTMRSVLTCFDTDPMPALVAPIVVGADGRPENSARRLPTPREIMRKALVRLHILKPVDSTEVSHWDWFAGMFMAFDVHAFRAVKGFDESYFLYYEDVDICCRIRLLGGRLHRCLNITIIHVARRDSHRHFRYFLHHFHSVLRFFSSSVYRRCRRLAANIRRQNGGRNSNDA